MKKFYRVWSQGLELNPCNKMKVITKLKPENKYEFYVALIWLKFYCRGNFLDLWRPAFSGQPLSSQNLKDNRQSLLALTPYITGQEIYE